MNLRQLSLTARMSLMFMSAVIAVLVIAGLSFYMLSQHHFQELDRQALVEKLESTRQILGKARNSENLENELPQLRALLGAHQDLLAIIVSGDGSVLFADSSATAIPKSFRHAAEQDLWAWQDGEQLFRGMTAQVTAPGQTAPLTILLALDVTNHAHFFVTLQRWFWIGLIICALLSAALGWVVARSGLRPLRQVTDTAASMSAGSLQQRIPLEPVPLELQQLVLSFNAMLARLEEDFIRLSNFSADIAHELRTPLSNLMTHTEVVLSRQRDSTAYEENLHANLDDLRRMSRMIDDMLFLAKADNGLIIPQQAPIALADLAAKLFEFYQLLAEEQGIQLAVSGSGEVRGDPLMLERAISNLLANALRYTPSGETIHLSIRQAASLTAVSIENPGSTIPPEHLQKLFDRFYRADPARREGNASNAGLGLAITRSIVEAHKGRIWCTSSDGLTGFHMEFPRQSS
ncbi:two-component system, OmpR family, heavy metal sensor histidine kinase CusS [Pseudomonas pohangensis]|uniref:Sensor protein n=1 Tax=Pseudomonas pohangensis TaxID=364197 RepID=A0A1H2H7Q1_9PSED|nr:heavy metal sensor histidine kinase [Pseudomonas pohangensis]SDU27769.1 two-component system, OmpR family, heavy metal sensor histidine kinase CusS [Pseudomonas pohangensis]